MIFVTPVAKTQTKAAASRTNSLAHQRSPLVANQRGHDAAGLAHMLQRTIGNQATVRLLAQLAQSPTANEHRHQRVQEREGLVRETPAASSWNFSKINIFPPDPANRIKIGAPDALKEREADSMANPLLQNRVAERGKGSALAMVEETLHSPGQSLDPEIRNFTETRFGHDFSQVKVHTDARAAESARGVNALAYTFGNHIAFDAGQYAPKTLTGMRLLSHELTHVVQQRRAPFVGRGLSAPGDFHERQAGAVADALIRGGDIAGLLDSGPCPTSRSLQRQPRAPAASQPLIYQDEHRLQVSPPPQGLTVAMVKQQLDQKVQQHKITSYTTKGGTGDAEVFLLNILFGLADPTRWRKEWDIVTAIGWPESGRPAPLGQVTVRIDYNGAASAELIATGVPAVTKQTTAAALQAQYKLASVGDDGTAQWSAAELDDVAEALAMLPQNDKAALEDVDLIRVKELKDRTRAGEFESPDKAAAGPEAVKQHATLRLASIAFDTSQFAEGSGKTVPGSVRIILHEVGHAVETEVYRSKWRSHAQALAETHEAADVQESAARQKQRSDIEAKLNTAKSEAEKKSLQKKLEQFDLERAVSSERAADKKAAETKLKEKTTEVLAMEGHPTERLTKFVDLVTKNHIAPISDYAAKGNKEFYAEAYSLWLVKPEFMKNNYRIVFDFFQSGDYRK